MPVARRLRFSSQSFQLIPGLKIFTLKLVLSHLLHIYEDGIFQRISIDDPAFSHGGNNALVALGELFSSVDILLVFIN